MFNLNINVLFVFRFVYILNALLYLILLQTIFGTSCSFIYEILNDQAVSKVLNEFQLYLE